MAAKKKVGKRISSKGSQEDVYQTTKPAYSITNSTFIGVQYDAKAVEAITLIAEGLIENARALANLAEVLKASNVHIDSMVKIPCD